MSRPMKILTAVSIVLFASQLSYAQSTTSGTVLTSEGISDYVDKKHRNPVVSVETQNNSAGVKILVDAYTPSEDFQEFPIRIDYYINRSFFTSQIRSKELPGPLGIDIGTDRATVPFNYSIVATLLHPNRQFMSIINGAVFETNLSGTLSSCSLTVSSGTGTQTYVTKDVKVVQPTNDGVTLNFSSSELSDGSSADTIEVAVSLTISSGSASGSVVTTLNEQENTVVLSGTSESSDSGNITTISAKSEDGATELSCE